MQDGGLRQYIVDDDADAVALVSLDFLALHVVPPVGMLLALVFVFQVMPLLQGKHLPGDATPQDEDNPGQAGPVIDRRSAPLSRFRLMSRKQWCEGFPKIVGYQ